MGNSDMPQDQPPKKNRRPPPPPRPPDAPLTPSGSRTTLERPLSPCNAPAKGREQLRLGSRARESLASERSQCRGSRSMY